jgi:glycosyltransferase involved in cell wall biosynthesis
VTRLLFLSADPGVPVLGHKGASVHVRELICALAALGADIHVASPRIGWEGDALEAPVRMHEIPGVLPKRCTETELVAAADAQAQALAELAARHEVDAIYERFSLFSAAGVRVAREFGLAHALEVNAPLREEAARYRTLPHPELAIALEEEVMDGTGRVLAVSRALAATLIDQGLAASKVEVVPNGVAAHRFPEPRRDPRRFVVGFAGSLKPWHGVETLVDAVSAVPGVHLEVFGAGPLEETLSRVPSDRIRCLGLRPHEEVLERMAGWDAGLAPYAPVQRFWFSPLKVLEYMAAATCPVVSDVGDARQTLGGGARGVLVPPADPGALACAIRALASDRENARRLGRRARDWVRGHRSWAVNAGRALAALQAPSLADTGGRPREG